MSDAWRFRIFRWVFSAYILIVSLRTLWSGLMGAHEGPHGPNTLVMLSSMEIVAAAAFLIEPIERYACAALLVTFALAAVLAIVAGDLVPVRFVYYGATALFIVLTQPRATLGA